MPDNYIITDREELLEAVRNDGGAIEYASDTLKADREVVLEAVRNDGGAIEYADDSLWADREFVLEAIKIDPWLIEYASDTLKADREVMLEAVRNDGLVLEYASEELQNDSELKKLAEDDALEFAPDSLKTDREVMLEAVRNDGLVLEYASDTLKADREVVLEAVRNNSFARQFASEELQNDPELKKLAGINNDSTTELNLKMSGMWEGDPEQNPEFPYYHCCYLIVWAELNSNEMAGVVCGKYYSTTVDTEVFYARHSVNELKSLVFPYRDDEDQITGEAADADSWGESSAEIAKIHDAAIEEIYRWIDQDMADEDILVLRPDRIQDLRRAENNTFLLRRNSHALVNSILDYAGTSSKPAGIVDREELLEAVKLECGYHPLNSRPDWEALKHADDSFQADREVVLAAVRNSGTSLKYASEALKDDREVVLEAVRNNGIALKYASDTLKDDHEVVLEAVKNNGNALRLASTELQDAPELKKYCSNIMIDSKSFREDNGVEDYYKSKLDLNIFTNGEMHYLIEWFVDNLGDALQWQDMKKGESKEFGTGTVLCVDRNLKVDTSDDDWIAAEGDILIMLTYDEYPDDTIKIRFKIDAIIDDDLLEIQDQSTYYLDSEGQENPLNYSNFLELYQILDDLA